MAGNTVNPTLLVLRAKGYELGFETSLEVNDQWRMVGGGNLFTADDPWVLLALLTIWEYRGDNWQNQEGEPFLWDDLKKTSK